MHRARRGGLVQLLREQAILLARRLHIPFFQGRFKMLRLRFNLALTRSVNSPSLGVLLDSFLR